ncbi:unnamed protein product [Lactuca virosa]|uniref:Uncharacterized protein n=1 Tax=Lactuca virosa TaxID=75947 RepID=A0AAU9N658_9ASTR|nr:unnamed protein product [Lactuca virosa]CAH1434257.1 unnamed protein product [Lactuca virosa]
MKGARSSYEHLVKESVELREEVVGLSERNRCLVDDMSERIRCQTELKNLNQDLQMKVDDAIIRRLKLSKILEERSQQLEALKSHFTEKVSQLEVSCSDKDVHIKLLEEEICFLQNCYD